MNLKSLAALLTVLGNKLNIKKKPEVKKEVKTEKPKS